MKSPFRRSDLLYTLLLPPLSSVAWWMIEQRVTTANGWAAWVQSWPEELAWSGIGIGIAFAVLEPFLPGSRTRALLDRRNNIAHHLHCWWEQVPGPPRRCEVYSDLVFRKRIKKLEVQLWGYHDQRPPTLIERRVIDVIKGEELRLVLATLPIHEGDPSPRFGGLSSTHTFGETDPRLVEIKLRGGLRRQTFRVLISVFAPSPNFNQRVIADENSPFGWPALAAGWS